MDWEREEEDLVKDRGEGGGGIRDWCSSLTMVALYYYNRYKLHQLFFTTGRSFSCSFIWMRASELGVDERS